MRKGNKSLRTDIAINTFYNKYALSRNQSWAEKAYDIVEGVCGTMWGRRRRILSKSECDFLVQMITEMKFIPAGRYIYYAKRRSHFWNNCLLMKGEEDTREEWARIANNSTSSLMSGAGIGCDYSVFRPKGRLLSRTGGISSGPMNLMYMVNEIGRNVMQGGSRRSAIYASLNWQHGDIWEFLAAKDWAKMGVSGCGITLSDVKQFDFNFPAPLDMTNISVNYDDEFLNQKEMPKLFLENVRAALTHGEPGFSFNFGDKQNETLRNACTEVTSEDDSDICNLGSINMARIESIEEMKQITEVAAKFLICGSIRADVPYHKVGEIREKNRRIGLGLMGIHDWLLQRGYKYEMNEELRDWLDVYQDYSESGANEHCDRLYLSRPKGYRAIAPTGTTGIIASTTTGIEPVYSVAYKRRYLVDGTDWKYEYVVDGTAKHLIETLGVDPDSIETAVDLANDPERRLSFQADVQEYVDHAISSTLNLPAWGTENNNPDKVEGFAHLLRKYAPRLRGFTCYPDGSRGGQPITSVPYEEAIGNVGTVFSEHDICDITGKGGSCGS
jgi:ribonucleoside-diphosphate reductase alpha chain